MQACFHDCIIVQHPVSGNYIGLGSQDSTNTEEDGVEAIWSLPAIWRQGEFTSSLCYSVWSKVAEVCSVSSNLGICIEAAKLLPDPNQLCMYHRHFCTTLLQQVMWTQPKPSVRNRRRRLCIYSS